MFSAHDSTCGAFMGFMKAVFGTDIRYPFFATNINLELINRKNDSGDNYFVKYIINDEEIEEFEYKDFAKKIRENKKSTSDINSFCGFDENEKGNSHVYLITNLILTFLTILLVIGLLLTIKKRKKIEGTKLEVEKAEPLNQLNEEEIIENEND